MSLQAKAVQNNALGGHRDKGEGKKGGGRLFAAALPFTPQNCPHDEKDGCEKQSVPCVGKHFEQEGVEAGEERHIGNEAVVAVSH